MIRGLAGCVVVLVACGPAQQQVPKPPVVAPAEPPAPVESRPDVVAPVDQASHWIAKLDDPREAERAVTELEQLGDPRAIGALGKAWTDQGRPVRILQVIISLARPLTPQQAAAMILPAYEQAGRPASWDDALPFLRQAIVEIDEASPRSVDSATRAAEAIGEAKLAAGLPALIELAQKPVSKKLIGAQVAAVRALGALGAAASAALVQIVDREPPPHPRGAKDPEDRRQREGRYSMALAVTGAAINALAEQRSEAATGALVLAMYRMPELMAQIRRALVASGPGAAGELRKVLRGQHAAVNQLFRARKLDQSCGDRGDAPCERVSAMDFYAAVALGDFHDAQAVPDLLAALKRPDAPAYILDDQPGPSQHAAILDALRKIGAPSAAPPLRALWQDRNQPVPTRAAAMATYAFVARDGAGVDELGKIAADNNADDNLRTEAALAYARLSRDARSIAILQTLAQKYLDASAQKRKESAQARPTADAADQALEPAKQALEAAKQAVIAATKDPQATADQIRAATARAKQAEADWKMAKQAHREKVQPFKQLDQMAKAYLGFARMFQTHIARVEIAARCRDDLTCYAASFRLTPDEAAKHVLPYVKDAFDWTPDEKRDLIAASIERAMLELGKRGAKAQAFTTTLLDHAASDQRLIRQSILLALPKIAKLPCPECVDKLDLAIKAAEGKTTLAELTLETTMLRNYFVWAK